MSVWKQNTIFIAFHLSDICTQYPYSQFDIVFCVYMLLSKENTQNYLKALTNNGLQLFSLLSAFNIKIKSIYECVLAYFVGFAVVAIVVVVLVSIRRLVLISILFTHNILVSCALFVYQIYFGCLMCFISIIYWVPLFGTSVSDR